MCELCMFSQIWSPMLTLQTVIQGKYMRVEVPADIPITVPRENVSVPLEPKAVPVLEESKGLSVTQQEDTMPATGLWDNILR